MNIVQKGKILVCERARPSLLLHGRALAGVALGRAVGTTAAAPPAPGHPRAARGAVAPAGA